MIVLNVFFHHLECLLYEVALIYGILNNWFSNFGDTKCSGQRCETFYLFVLVIAVKLSLTHFIFTGRVFVLLFISVISFGDKTPVKTNLCKTLLLIYSSSFYHSRNWVKRRRWIPHTDAAYVIQIVRWLDCMHKTFGPSRCPGYGTWQGADDGLCLYRWWVRVVVMINACMNMHTSWARNWNTMYPSWAGVIIFKILLVQRVIWRLLGKILHLFIWELMFKYKPTFVQTGARTDRHKNIQTYGHTDRYLDRQILE